MCNFDIRSIGSVKSMILHNETTNMYHVERGLTMFGDDEDVRRALVTLYIEKTLLDIGKPVYDKVVGILNTEYHCYLPDCYEHPEYLDEILKKLYGNASKVIVESIARQLEEFNYHSKIKKFLEVICN
jgi:hypothetical protein